MRSVMVLNTKGGAGKTTIATTLAGYYADQGHCTAIKDYDPQGSSWEWLQQRPISRAEIHGIAAFKPSNHTTRVWQMRLPVNTERLIIDTPAGVELPKVASLFRTIDRIIVPVVPSPIDIRASAMFIRELTRFVKMYPTNAEVGVVASRVPPHSSSFQAMQRLFSNLDIKIIGRLNQSDAYFQAAEHGISMLEMQDEHFNEDRQAWTEILNWIEGTEQQSDRTVTPLATFTPKRFVVGS